MVFLIIKWINNSGEPTTHKLIEEKVRIGGLF